VRTLLAGIVPVALLGAACGLGTGVYLSRFIEVVLFGVTALDPWSIALPLTALLATAVAAVILPAWRAARVDPVIALRNE
jgi:putative ABC transport system permease protein